MNALSVVLSVVLLLSSLAIPARADFKYTNSTKMTGGSLYGMMKLAARFSKKGQSPLDPVISTYYIKGDRMRTDSPGGVTQIIDLEGRRMISINTQARTYSVVTFDDMKAAMQKAMQQLQQVQQQAQQPAEKPQDVQVTLKPKIQITPGTGNRIIMGQSTNETTMEMDMEMQAQANGQPVDQPGGQAPASAPGAAPGSQTVSGTMAFSIDMYVAPSVAGFQELGEFYKRMAKEIDWVPPSNFQFDPRMKQGLEEFQKNSSALQGLPMLENITMGFVLTPEQQAQLEAAQKSAANSAQQSNASSGSSSSPSRTDSIPTTPSGLVVKGLGGMFGKKKQQQQDNASAQNAPSQNGASQNGSSQDAAGGNASGNLAALMIMTVEVTSFSNSSLDGAMFDIPAGFTEVKADPGQALSLGRGPKT